MGKQHFHIDGLRELDEALKELPKATARNVLLRTLKKRAQPIADDGESFAPKLTGELSESYVVSTKLSRREKRANKKESMVEVYVGPTPHAKSVQTEFGNAHQSAHPHLRPAWDGNWPGVLDGTAEDLGEEIEKVRKRLARKAEREAAKMKT